MTLVAEKIEDCRVTVYSTMAIFGVMSDWLNRRPMEQIHCTKLLEDWVSASGTAMPQYTHDTITFDNPADALLFFLAFA